MKTALSSKWFSYITDTKFSCHELIAVGIRSLRRDLVAHGREEVCDFLSQIVPCLYRAFSVALIVN